jgi:hypothetical protein
MTWRGPRPVDVIADQQKEGWLFIAKTSRAKIWMGENMPVDTPRLGRRNAWDEDRDTLYILDPDEKYAFEVINSRGSTERRDWMW